MTFYAKKKTSENENQNQLDLVIEEEDERNNNYTNVENISKSLRKRLSET